MMATSSRVGEETALDAPADLRRSTKRRFDWTVAVDFRRNLCFEQGRGRQAHRDLDLQNRLGAHHHATAARRRRHRAPRKTEEAGDQLASAHAPGEFPGRAAFLRRFHPRHRETEFGSVAIGMVLGVFLGMRPIPLPGGGVARLGLAGGPLLVALLIGKIERSGRVTWVIPISANLTLRQIGLLLFMAGVGTRAGFTFAGTLRSNGMEMLAAGAVLTFGVTLGTMIFGYKVSGGPMTRCSG
jgi:putative transport protein